MFCRNCGAEVKDDWKICPNCGKVIVRNNVKHEQLNQQEKKKNKKKIIVGVIIGVIVVGCVGIVYGVNANKTKNTHQETTTASKIEKKKKESKGVANQDFEKLLDKSEDEIKKLGLKWNDEEQEYASANQDIEIKFKNGKIDYISIYGDEKNAPMSHGVRLGMSEKVARKKLKKTYSEEIPVSEGFALWNLEKKREVWCFIKNDEVNQITYHALTEGDVKRYEEDVAGEYVFKDSDKKYLSKDEVKSVDSSMLNIGKNEIYARHGYIFADENLKQYFEEKLWYKGEVTADQFDENQLNSFEKKNIELINTIEAKENQMSDSTDTQIENINSFVGEEGTYYSGNVGEAEDADAGRIDVWREDNDIYLAIGSSKDFPILNGSGNGIKGIIRNKNTVIIKDGDKLMFSLVWHDKGSFTITRFQNTGSELLDMINIDTPYVNAKYYGVSD